MEAMGHDDTQSAMSTHNLSAFYSKNCSLIRPPEECKASLVSIGSSALYPFSPAAGILLHMLTQAGTVNKLRVMPRLPLPPHPR